MGAPQEKTRTILNGCDISVFHPSERLEARRKLHIDPQCRGRGLPGPHGREERACANWWKR